jgi:HD-GYP domain-containing protein (c-di-GMP phosphodiesterase class II)
MYVAELDRSWLHSPFSAPGFLITGRGQIDQLRQICRYVYIDPARSEHPPGNPRAPKQPAAEVSATSGPGPLDAARRSIAEAVRSMSAVVRSARRHSLLDLDRITLCADHLCEQVLDHCDALLWVLRTEDHGGLLFRRAAGTAVTATIIGHQLGFERPALQSLAMGGLLLDLGKIAVPVPILAKPLALDGAEHAYVRRHVERGLELVAGRDLSPRALEMIAGHHERLDGSGYPHEVHGTHIPVFARIAAIADSFDAMTLNRRYAAAMSPHAALRQLDGLRGEKFDAALVDELGRALGLYPVGTLVELVNGSLGLVCGQRHRQPLQPHVIVTHDAGRQALAEPVVVEADGAMDIVRTLPPHVLRIDTARLESALRTLHHAA